jgi:hypothetical protein
LVGAGFAVRFSTGFRLICETRPYSLRFYLIRDP